MNDASGLYFTMDFETKVIRVIENTLVPVVLKIQTDVSGEVDMHSVEMAKATLKIKAWLDGILTNSVLISMDNPDGGSVFFDAEGNSRSANNVVLTPGTPTDEMMAVLLQAKFDALAGRSDTFVSCEVRSDNLLNLRSTFVGLASDFLPTMDEWIGSRTYFDQPWWNRDDISTYDVVPADGADLSKKPAFAQSIVVNGFETDAKTWSGEARMGAKPKASFKPKIITGGKGPDEPKD